MKVLLFILGSLGLTLDSNYYEDVTNEYHLGDLHVSFINASECGCDETCNFQKLSDDKYVFNIATNFNSKHKIKIETDFTYDSLFVYQREIYQYAMVISETEGIIFYDTDSTNKINFKEGYWRFLPLNSKNEFTIYDKFETTCYPSMMPDINIEKAKLYLAKRFLTYSGEENDTGKIMELISERTFGVYVDEIQIRLKYYVKGKIVRKTLTFNYRHGEC